MEQIPNSNPPAADKLQIKSKFQNPNSKQNPRSKAQNPKSRQTKNERSKLKENSRKESKEPRISARAALAKVAGQTVPGEFHRPAFDVAFDLAIGEGALELHGDLLLESGGALDVITLPILK